MKERLSSEEVMTRLHSNPKTRHLIPHMFMDRDWIWYCGPSLKDFPETRKEISELGFRWSKKGHQMPDGHTMGSWSNSCQRPIFKRRKPVAHEAPDPMAELCNMFL